MVEEGVLSSVKKIVDVYTAENGERYFRITWRDTWEAESNLISCEELVEEFWSEKKRKILEENSENTTKHENTLDAVVPTTCHCGKSPKKKIFADKNIQHSPHYKRLQKGIQVNTFYKKKHNVGLQIGLPCTFNSDLGVQVDTLKTKNVIAHSHKKCSIGVQVSLSNQRRVFDKNYCNFGAQVNTFVRPQKHAQVQVSNDPVLQFSQQNKKNNRDDLSHSCAIQNVASQQDQCSQFETSFTDNYEGDIAQKEASVQFSPIAIHCGTQTWLYSHDQCTQSSVNIFQREISCQISPRTVSCGIQKNTLLVDKCTQYEENLALSENHNFSSDKRMLNIVRSPYSSYNCKHHQNEDVKERTVERNILPFDKNSSYNKQNEINSFLEKNNSLGVCSKSEVQNKRFCVNIDNPVQIVGKESAIATQLLNAVDKSVPKTSVEIIADVKEEDRTTKKDVSMKEMIFLADVPSDLNQHDDMGQYQTNITSTSISTSYTSEIPLTVNNTKLTANIGINSTPLQQNLLFQLPTSGTQSQQSATSSTLTLEKYSTSQTNINFASPNLIQSHQLNSSKTQPLVVQHQNEINSMIANSEQFVTLPTVLSQTSFVSSVSTVTATQVLIGQLKNTPINGQGGLITTSLTCSSLSLLSSTNATSSVAVQLLGDNIPPITGRVNSINQNLSEQNNIFTQPTDPIALMYNYFKSPTRADTLKETSDEHKKKKRKKIKDGESSDDVKPKKRSRRKRSVEENADLHCLPIYEIMPDATKDEQSLGSVVSGSTNDDIENDASKYIDHTEIPSSDANEINDDFISRYWK